MEISVQEPYKRPNVGHSSNIQSFISPKAKPSGLSLSLKDSKDCYTKGTQRHDNRNNVPAKLVFSRWGQVELQNSPPAREGILGGATNPFDYDNLQLLGARLQSLQGLLKSQKKEYYSVNQQQNLLQQKLYQSKFPQNRSGVTNKNELEIERKFDNISSSTQQYYCKDIEMPFKFDE